jgi:hypothetical protein
MKKDSYYIELEKKEFYKDIDKRSKDYREYKEWKASKVPRVDYETFNKRVAEESKGLGDIVAKVTKATGIDKVVKFIAGEDCGCDERQEKWNKIPMFSRKKPNCIKEDDYNYLVNFFKVTTSKVDRENYVKIVGIYNYVFKSNEPTKTSCGPCAARIYRSLKTYIETYN